MDGEGNLKSNFAGFSNDLKCASMTGSKVISMCIVPVKVKYGDGKDMITTYTMLDNCSQSPFIHDQGLGLGTWSPWNEDHFKP